MNAANATQRHTNGEPHADATVNTGVLLVIAGPSGAGKGTIVQRLKEREPDASVVGVVDDARTARRARSTASTTTSRRATSSSVCATPAASSSGSTSTAT